eukprot:8919563-Ditylum_brightwellii.AAC.1
MHKVPWEPHAIMELPSGKPRELREPRESVSKDPKQHMPEPRGTEPREPVSKEPEQRMPEPRGTESRDQQLELPLSREKQQKDVHLLSVTTQEQSKRKELRGEVPKKPQQTKGNEELANAIGRME